jgi:rRNA biogenesis protein RRP5
MLELSLRDTRLEGDMDDDAIPDANEMVHAYVISTTKKGCFVRLSRSVEGRVILKELSDDFIPNPSAMFPPGRLVVGKVKGVNEEKSTVDIDMRESVLLTSGDRLTLDDIEEQSKYTGVVSRVESYGVFVRIDNSDVSGLAHVSECSDNYIKNISDLYNPGDMVKRECWMS